MFESLFGNSRPYFNSGIRLFAASLKAVSVIYVGNNFNELLRAELLLSLSIISFLPFLLTIEFSSLSLRSFLRSVGPGFKRWHPFFQASIFVNSFVTLLVTPLLLFALTNFGIKFEIISVILIISLVYLEGLGNELVRLCPPFDMHITGSIFFLIRQVILIFALLIFGYFYSNTKVSVIWFLLMYFCLTLILNLYFYHFFNLQKNIGKHLSIKSLNKKRLLKLLFWARSLLPKLLVLFAAGITGKFIFGLDRILLSFILPVDIYSAYVFCLMIVGGVVSIADPFIVQFLYPSLIEAKRKKAYAKILPAIRNGILKAFTLNVVLMFFLLVLYELGLTKNYNVSYFELLILSLIGGCFLLSQVMQSVLFSYERDKVSLWSNVVAVILFIFGLYFYGSDFQGLILVLLCACSFSLCMRVIYVYRILNETKKLL